MNTKRGYDDLHVDLRRPVAASKEVSHLGGDQIGPFKVVCGKLKIIVNDYDDRPTDDALSPFSATAGRRRSLVGHVHMQAISDVIIKGNKTRHFSKPPVTCKYMGV